MVGNVNGWQWPSEADLNRQVEKELRGLARKEALSMCKGPCPLPQKQLDAFVNECVDRIKPVDVAMAQTVARSMPSVYRGTMQSHEHDADVMAAIAELEKSWEECR